jgi:glycosyltransferase involved in cell wall biosynthesis
LPSSVTQVTWAGGRAPAGLKNGLSLLLDLRRVIHTSKPDLILAGPIQTAAFLTALVGFHPLVSMSWGYDLLLDAERNSLWRRVTRYTLKRSDAMVGDCVTIRQRAVALGMLDERIVTFPWGVDLSHFTPASATEVRPEGVFRLISTRGWEPVYGVEVIARAFVIAAQQLKAQSDPELQLIMLGNGSQASLLRQIFIQGGVWEQVSFPGQVSQQDLPRLYQTADLYVSASHSDGSSISLLEALACGRPVVVSDIPGNREWVTPGIQGWWFPDGDAQALAQAILDVVRDRHNLPEIGRAARLLAEQRADWAKNFPELIRAFDIASKPRNKDR